MDPGRGDDLMGGWSFPLLSQPTKRNAGFSSASSFLLELQKDGVCKALLQDLVSPQLLVEVYTGKPFHSDLLAPDLTTSRWTTTFCSSWRSI